MITNEKSFLQGDFTNFAEKNETLYSLLIQFLNDNKDNEQICVKLGQTELRLSQLAVAAQRVATSLTSYKLIAICMQPSFEFIITLCATIISGIPYIPIDPILPFERIKYILQDSQAQVIVTA